jgi:hypothetical protein
MNYKYYHTIANEDLKYDAADLIFHYQLSAAFLPKENHSTKIPRKGVFTYVLRADCCALYHEESGFVLYKEIRRTYKVLCKNSHRLIADRGLITLITPPGPFKFSSAELLKRRHSYLLRWLTHTRMHYST